MVKRNMCNGREVGRSEISLSAGSKPAACVGGPCTSSSKVPAWCGNAQPPDENGLRAEDETASGGDTDGVCVDNEHL
jgi:hypothetical protein